MSCDIREHDWVFGIEEGCWHVSTPTCGPECNFLPAGDEHPGKGQLGDESEWTVLTDVSAKVFMATNCPAYPTDNDCVPNGRKTLMPGYESGGHWIAHGSHCDCDWWPVIRLSTPGEES